MTDRLWNAIFRNERFNFKFSSKQSTHETLKHLHARIKYIDYIHTHFGYNLSLQKWRTTKDTLSNKEGETIVFNKSSLKHSRSEFDYVFLTVEITESNKYLIHRYAIILRIYL